MAKPSTSTLRIAPGEQLTISVSGQSGQAVCCAGALEAGNWTNWTPQVLAEGVQYTPKGPCALEFLADFLSTAAAPLTVQVVAPSKKKTWTVKAIDGNRQTWQLWVLVK